MSSCKSIKEEYERLLVIIQTFEKAHKEFFLHGKGTLEDMKCLKEEAEKALKLFKKNSLFLMAKAIKKDPWMKQGFKTS